VVLNILYVPCIIKLYIFMVYVCICVCVGVVCIDVCILENEYEANCIVFFLRVGNNLKNFDS